MAPQIDVQMRTCLFIYGQSSVLRPLGGALRRALVVACGAFVIGCAAAPTVHKPQPLSSEWSRLAVTSALTRVADWQLAHPSKHPTYHWAQAAFYAGAMSLAEVSADPKYLAAMRAVGKDMGYQLGPRWGHADDHAVGQMYAQLYLIERNPEMLAPTLRVAEPMLRMPFAEPLTWDEDVHKREWAWCDALFMSPPMLALLARATGDRAYIELMNKLWWKSTDFLYDRDEHLYYRDSRYFDQREPNGKKVFWSRGNGWVFAGLARVLAALPAEDPLRPRFEALFKDMAHTLLRLQPSDGFFRASLLDPKSVPNPESSGTAFFIYGMAAGINMGLLSSADFTPAIRKGWTALLSAVGPDGKLGFVQEIGHGPGTATRETTEAYGPGAFLLAGVEILKLAARSGTSSQSVTVTNPSDEARFDATVEVPWSQLTAAFGPDVQAASLQVVNASSTTVLPLQAFDATGDGTPDQLLFQTHLWGNEKQTFLVMRAPSVDQVLTPPVPYPTFGRLVPERKDDIAWENDRVAFRMYGPALERAGEVASGIDLWSKRVRTSVINGWYKSDDYHADHGEGLDFYKVGTSRGCGGVGVWADQKLLTSRNYTKASMLSTGPLRVAFVLDYDAWGSAGQRITERKRVSLDRGHNLNRIELDWRFEGAPLTLAAGIVKRGESGAYAKGDAFGAYWEPADVKNGSVGCAVVFPPGARHTETSEQHLLMTELSQGKPFVYFAGGTWSKAVDFLNADAWAKHVKAQSRMLFAPLIVH